MSRFLLLLICLSGVSFFAGLHSGARGEAVSAPSAEATVRPAEKVETSRRARAYAHGQREPESDLPRLPAEVLDSVEFEKISGGQVTPVARRLLRLSWDQTARVKELIAWRDAELLALRQRQELKAVLVEPDSEWKPDFTWEIPVDMEGRRKIGADFRSGVEDAVGGENALRLLGAADSNELGEGFVMKHLLNVERKGSFQRGEFIVHKGRRYNGSWTRNSLDSLDVSDHLRALIERQLAGQK